MDDMTNYPKYDEAFRVMDDMVTRALEKAGAGKAYSKEQFDAYLTEAFLAIPSSFKDRADLRAWFEMAMHEQEKRIRASFASLCLLGS